MKLAYRFLVFLFLCAVSIPVMVSADTQPPQTAGVYFSLAGGIYNTPQELVLTSATPGAVIYYNTNGKTPNASSTKYTVPIKIASTELVTAIAIAPGYSASGESAKSYVYVPDPIAPAPYFSLAGGTYSSPQTLTLTTSVPGASICYTTNGKSPVDDYSEFDDCTMYTGPITVDKSELVKAASKAKGYNVSNVSSKLYTFTN